MPNGWRIVCMAEKVRDGTSVIGIPHFPSLSVHPSQITPHAKVSRRLILAVLQYYFTHRLGGNAWESTRMICQPYDLFIDSVPLARPRDNAFCSVRLHVLMLSCWYPRDWSKVHGICLCVCNHEIRSTLGALYAIHICVPLVIEKLRSRACQWNAPCLYWAI